MSHWRHAEDVIGWAETIADTVSAPFGAAAHLAEQEFETFIEANVENAEHVLGDSNPRPHKVRRTGPGEHISEGPQTTSAHAQDNNSSQLDTDNTSEMPGNFTDGGEVPIIPPPAKVAKIAPDYFTVQLPWYEAKSFTLSNSSNIVNNVYRLNSITDPNFTGTATHQPLGHDNWATFYKYYRVLEADVTIKWKYEAGFFQEMGQASTGPNTDTTSCLVGWELTDDAAALFPDVQTMVEGKQSKVDFLHPQSYNIYDATDMDMNSRCMCNGGFATQTFHYNPNQWDYTVKESAESERWTPTGSDPSVQHYLAIRASMAGNNDNDTLRAGDIVYLTAWVHISYKVQFRELLDTLKKVQDDAPA